MEYNFIKQWQDVGRSLNHSSFDLSRRQCITMPTSLLCPNFFLETMPNEHHRISLQGLLRTQTLNTAAFVNGSFYTNLFFVPYSQLWHRFNDFISQKSDKHSTSYHESAYVPNVLLTDIIKLAYNFHTYSVQDSDFNDLMGIDVGYNIVRLLQLCKYGNFFPIFSMTRENLLEYCDELDNTQNGDGTATYTPKYINLFRPLAYQHIFYDYYRNKFYDMKPFLATYVHNGPGYQNYQYLNYIDSFNVDDQECSDEATSHMPVDFEDLSSVSALRALSIFSMHYHQYKRDIYTSAMPSTQFGAVSSLSIKDINIVNKATDSVGGVNISSSQSLVAPNAQYAVASTNTPNRYLWNIPDAFDVLQLRKAELMQAWKQNALRAGNMVDDNFRSHYGVEPYYEEDNNVKFLGSFSCHLDINPVTATAATGDGVNGNVGDLAAIGVGQFQGNEINFESKDFGVIVGVTSFVPDVYYRANGVDKPNTLIEPFDYFYPEFQNIGFESLPLHNQSVSRPAAWNMNIGFVPPQSWYKTAVDEVYGDFASAILFNKDNQALGYFNASMDPWVLSRADDDYLNTIENVPTWFEVQRGKKALYIDPAITNNIFPIMYESGMPTEDPFALALQWNVRSIRPMSVLGLPQFT